MYPIIRLPREFNNLAGAKGTILKTVYKGALAFLVVINDRPLKGAGKGSGRGGRRNRSLHTAEVTGSNPVELIFFADYDYNFLK